jgi:uncharacterized protein (TIGR01777 family)
MSAPRVHLISGATGLVGSRLAAALIAEGLVVRALTRNLREASARLDPRALLVRWDGAQIPVDAVNGTDAIVHLAGEPIFAGPLTAGRRRAIHASRVESTRSLVRAIAALPESSRPQVLVCASAVGYYGSRGDEELPEEAPPGEGFLAQVCREWEAAALQAEDLGVRCLTLRIGVVIAREGGALPRLALPFRYGLGGRLGSGRQWFPWIHVADLVALVSSVLRDNDYRGAVNAVAPEPVRNRDLTRVVAAQLGRPNLLPVPAFALRAVLGELADELLGSRRVIPQRALAGGFEFRHHSIESAIEAELGGDQ